MTKNVFSIGINAAENASLRAVNETQIVTILQTGDGPGNLVRSLFGDCSLDSLDSMAAAARVSRRQLIESYRNARAKHAAANDQIDALMSEFNPG